MGQALQKLGTESEEKKEKDIGPIIGKCYDMYFADPNKEWTSAEFYHAISDTVEEINKTLGSTQFRVPKIATLERVYKHHHEGKGKNLTQDEFRKILQELIFHTGFMGIGAKDMLMYTFGIPITTLFIKQRILPTAIPNEVFITGITSATVFLLAKLNKF